MCPSNMSAGSMMWSSMLTRIMSSICMAHPRVSICSPRKLQGTPPCGARSEDGAGRLRLDDGVPVPAEGEQDLVGVRAELRCRHELGWLAIELHRVRDERQLAIVPVVDGLHEPVGERLRVDADVGDA